MTDSPTKIGWYPRVASYDMLGEQLYNCNPEKYGYATYLPHKDGGIPLSALPKDTTSKLVGLFSALSLFYAKRQVGKLRIPFFKSPLV